MIFACSTEVIGSLKQATFDCASSGSVGSLWKHWGRIPRRKPTSSNRAPHSESLLSTMIHHRVRRKNPSRAIRGCFSKNRGSFLRGSADRRNNKAPALPVSFFAFGTIVKGARDPVARFWSFGTTARLPRKRREKRGTGGSSASNVYFDSNPVSRDGISRHPSFRRPPSTGTGVAPACGERNTCLFASLLPAFVLSSVSNLGPNAQSRRPPGSSIESKHGSPISVFLFRCLLIVRRIGHGWFPYSFPQHSHLMVLRLDDIVSGVFFFNGGRRAHVL